MNAFESNQQLYATCESAGLKVYSDDECCRAMAWLLAYGGGTEKVLGGSIQQVIVCAQHRLNLLGGEVPNAELLPIFLEYHKSIADLDSPPEWVLEFEKKHKLRHRGG